jgi:phospholipase C
VRNSVRNVGAALAAVWLLVACGSGSNGVPAPSGAMTPQWSPASSGSGSNLIQHVVLVIQENRSFDDFFATFPGADGATGGMMKTPSGDQYVPLKEVKLAEPCDFGHSWLAYRRDWDKGKMDAFNLEGGGNCPGQAGTRNYQYVNPRQIAPYWTIASQWVLGDQMFTTQGSGSFTAHQDLIAGGTMINAHKTKSLVDIPNGKPWGCDAPPGTVTSLLVDENKKMIREYDKGPFPCLTYATMRDLLDAKSVSWKYYSPPEPHGSGSLWNAFDAIKAVREGSEWTTNIAPSKQFFSDVSGGTLPAVSWIVPDSLNSDHPGNHSDTGPSWVGSIVNAIGESSYWNSSVVIVVWDDWGGFYDNVPPPLIDRWGGLGFRVAMLLVSPYAVEGGSSQPGYISHTPYEFGSILKFMEEVWGLGSLGTTDERATSIVDCFDFTQAPRPFTPIATKYSRAYFLRQAPSYKPVDTE